MKQLFSDSPFTKPKYTYDVVSYSWTHSALQLQVTNHELNERVYWLFKNVYYFEGPLAWTDTLLQQMPDSYAVRFIRSLPMFQTVSDQELITGYKLFAASSATVQVKIVAHEGGPINSTQL